MLAPFSVIDFCQSFNSVSQKTLLHPGSCLFCGVFFQLGLILQFLGMSGVNHVSQEPGPSHLPCPLPTAMRHRLFIKLVLIPVLLGLILSIFRMQPVMAGASVGF